MCLRVDCIDNGTQVASSYLGRFRFRSATYRSKERGMFCRWILPSLLLFGVSFLVLNRMKRVPKSYRGSRIGCGNGTAEYYDEQSDGADSNNGE